MVTAETPRSVLQVTEVEQHGHWTSSEMLTILCPCPPIWLPKQQLALQPVTAKTLPEKTLRQSIATKAIESAL